MLAKPSRVDPGHVVEDQSAVFALLADPATHGIAGPVERIDTHGAAVFLAGTEAYKVKRAVKFPFMDFSTLEKRRSACEAEVTVNGPVAPGIYKGVVALVRQADGSLALGGPGAPVDYAVHMRRFDEHRTLDRVAAEGGLDPALVARLVEAVRASHALAPERPGGPAADALATWIEQNGEAFAEQPDVFPPERAARLVDRSRAEWRRLRPLLVARADAGFVRRCHGDLHLSNIALIDGRPTLFDAIEFDDRIATGDVLYDLAFLVMDCRERGLRREANEILGRYLAGSGERMLEGLAALPLFLSIRAGIRAKVVAAGLSRLGGEDREGALAEVRRYFALAEEVLEPTPPVLLALGGLSGTGKSTVAGLIAADLGRIPGAVHLRSDTIRKALAGVAETRRLPAAAYTAATGEAVYAALRARAAAVLAAGSAVIVDAVHARPGERQALEAVARAAGVRFVGAWLEAPVDTLVRRVDRRGAEDLDASDADADVVRRQAAYDVGSIGWTRVAAGADPARVAGRVRALLA